MTTSIWISLRWATLSMLFFAAVPPARSSADDLVVVVGAAGEEEYGVQFRRWGTQWVDAAHRLGWKVTAIGLQSTGEDREEKAASDRERLLETCRSQAGNAPDDLSPVWLVLVGHGTYQQEIANFNLVGPDLAAGELAASLADSKRPWVIINCASASAPWLQQLGGPNRILITATRSGDEQNFARFGGYLADAVGSDLADLDHDDQISILEAFLYASGQVAKFYQQEARIPTEHALLDDNGDGRGTPAEFFRGTLLRGAAEDGMTPDGPLASIRIVRRTGLAPAVSPQQQQSIDQLLLQVNELRAQKETLAEEDYFQQLELLVRELAKIESMARLDRGNDRESSSSLHDVP